MTAKSARVGRIGLQPSQAIPSLLVAHPAREALTTISIIKALNRIIGFLPAAHIFEGRLFLPGAFVIAAGRKEAQGNEPAGDHNSGEPQGGAAQTRRR